MIEERRRVYDIGAHIGEDTAYYLQRGYNVVAVDANPALIEGLRQRFARSISDNRLILVHAAIIEQPGDQVAFFVSSEPGESSLDSTRINELGMVAEQIMVPACRIAELFSHYGKGLYCKMDIEGGDIQALKSLNPTNNLPDFFSIEISGLPIHALLKQRAELFMTLEELKRLGYRKFKLVDQYTLTTLTQAPFYSRQRFLYKRIKQRLARIFGFSTPTLNPRAWYSRKHAYRFTTDSSGVFGDDIVGEWQGAELIHEIIDQRFEEFYKFEENEKHIFWVDLHGAK
jgi:FkbM family methyltransferase